MASDKQEILKLIAEILEYTESASETNTPPDTPPDTPSQLCTSCCTSACADFIDTTTCQNACGDWYLCPVCPETPNTPDTPATDTTNSTTNTPYTPDHTRTPRTPDTPETETPETDTCKDEQSCCTDSCADFIDTTSCQNRCGTWYLCPVCPPTPTDTTEETPETPDTQYTPDHTRTPRTPVTPTVTATQTQTKTITCPCAGCSDFYNMDICEAWRRRFSNPNQYKCVSKTCSCSGGESNSSCANGEPNSETPSPTETPTSTATLTCPTCRDKGHDKKCSDDTCYAAGTEYDTCVDCKKVIVNVTCSDGSSRTLECGDCKHCATVCGAAGCYFDDTSCQNEIKKNGGGKCKATTIKNGNCDCYETCSCYEPPETATSTLYTPTPTIETPTVTVSCNCGNNTSNKNCYSNCNDCDVFCNGKSGCSCQSGYPVENCPGSDLNCCCANYTPNTPSTPETKTTSPSPTKSCCPPTIVPCCKDPKKIADAIAELIASGKGCVSCSSGYNIYSDPCSSNEKKCGDVVCYTGSCSGLGREKGLGCKVIQGAARIFTNICVDIGSGPATSGPCQVCKECRQASSGYTSSVSCT